MHVGHLRSSIIGDALVRILGFLGSEVVKQNHLGDWGTQFGMLIQYIDEHPEANWRASELSEESPVAALDNLYKAARGEFDADPEFADRDRKSTRLNSSHVAISYAAFCLNKKTMDKSDT